MRHDSLSFAMEKKLPGSQTPTQAHACQQKARSSEPRKKELGCSQHSDPRTQLRLTPDRAYHSCMHSARIIASARLSAHSRYRAFKSEAGAEAVAGVESEAGVDTQAREPRSSTGRSEDTFALGQTRGLLGGLLVRFEWWNGVAGNCGVEWNGDVVGGRGREI